MNIPAGREVMPNLAESSENAKIPSGFPMSRRNIHIDIHTHIHTQR